MNTQCNTCRYLAKDLMCWQPDLATVDYDYYGGAHCRQVDPRIVNDDHDCIFFEERLSQAASLAGVGVIGRPTPTPKSRMGC